MTTADAVPPSYRALFAYPRYLAFWLGQVTSVVGSSVSLIALPALVLPARGATAFGLVIAAQALAGVLLLLFGGVIADRYSRSVVMAIADAVCVVGVAGFLAFAESGPLALLMGAACLVGVGGAIYQPAHRAAMPQVVPQALLQKANALESATKRLGAAGGALLGGVLIATVGARGAFVVDLATYAVSLVTLLWLRLPALRTGDVPPGVRAVLTEARDGVREVRRRPWALVIMIQGTLQVFFLFAPNYALVPIVSQQRWGPEAYGWLSASASIGMMLGSAVAGRIRTRRPGLWAMNALVPCAILPLCLALPVSLPLWCLVEMLAWGGIGVFFVLWFTALQTEFPAEVHGRVFSLESIGNFALQPIAIAVAPLLASTIGMGVFVAIAVFVMVASTYGVFLVRGVTELRSPRPVV
ncbi:MFS family permease [Hamadaea flava]|uniref:MFS transporter n=1 Tax=Hamadaea flava TaxID=1742688 RepID=A0ABV8M0X8_9ACTN|nr:MFS transporter [Hamadaea flava]MCP2328559.1 MFS family permease [Hamadaea flava]